MRNGHCYCLNTSTISTTTVLKYAARDPVYTGLTLVGARRAFPLDTFFIVFDNMESRVAR